MGPIRPRTTMLSARLFRSSGWSGKAGEGTGSAGCIGSAVFWGTDEWKRMRLVPEAFCLES